MKFSVLLILKLFLLIIIVSECSTDTNNIAIKDNGPKIKSIDSVEKRKKYNDSINHWSVIQKFRIIRTRIANDWININDTTCSLHIDIDTKPRIFLEYTDSNNSSYHNVTDVKNYKDSLVLTTSDSGKDSILIWTFQETDKDKGTWAIFTPQSNEYKKLGAFIVPTGASY